jgi:hypothetical protein
MGEAVDRDFIRRLHIARTIARLEQNGGKRYAEFRKMHDYERLYGIFTFLHILRILPARRHFTTAFRGHGS